MVTLANTQNLNEFELHLYAVLGLPIPGITQEHIGASAVILSPIASKEAPRYRGEELVCSQPNTYLRIFGKPFTKLNRRMGVVVCYDKVDGDLDALRDKCKALAAKVVRNKKWKPVHHASASIFIPNGMTSKNK